MKAPASIRDECGSRRTSHLLRADRVSSFGVSHQAGHVNFRMENRTEKMYVNNRVHARTNSAVSVASVGNQLCAVVC